MESGVCYTSTDLIQTKEQAVKVRERFLSTLGLDDAGLGTVGTEALVDRTLRAFAGGGGANNMTAQMLGLVAFFHSDVGQPSLDGDILPELLRDLRPLPLHAAM